MQIMINIKSELVLLNKKILKLCLQTFYLTVVIKDLIFNLESLSIKKKMRVHHLLIDRSTSRDLQVKLRIYLQVDVS